MKYAFIVLIVIYLITYGCSSDEQKPETKSPKKVETITVEKTQPVAPAIAEEQSAQAPGEQPVVPQQPENFAAVTEPQPAQEQPLADSTQQQPMTEEQGTLFVNPENLVVMPCGRVFIREEAPCDMPCMNMPQPGGQMMQEEPAMPQMMMQERVMPQTAPVTPQDELTVAMQKMVEATNEMVMVTRQMVIATEEMLKATKGAAGEIIDTGKEILEAEKPEAAEQQPSQPAQPAQPTEQAIQPQAQVPAPAQSPEEGVVESMKDVVAAAKEVVEVTNEAISKAVEHQHHQ